MKFSTIAVIATFLAGNNAVQAFAPPQLASRTPTSLFDADMPAAPAADTSVEMPVIQSRGGAPVDVRYSDFLRLVNGDKIEKVTFSADGTQLLGVDTDGTRLKLEALPNDPDLLSQLTSHKVDVTVLPSNEAAGGLGDLAQSLILPAALFRWSFLPLPSFRRGNARWYGRTWKPHGYGKIQGGDPDDSRYWCQL